MTFDAARYRADLAQAEEAIRAAVHMKSTFPAVWDSTTRKDWISCQEKFKWARIRSLSKPSVHLVAGGAFASGLHAGRVAFHEQNQTEEEALEAAKRAAIRAWGEFCPVFSWDDSAPRKSLDGVLHGLDYYWTTWPPSTDPLRPLMLEDGLGTPRVAAELRFAVPLAGTRHPTTGFPLFYAGRLDLLAEFGGAYFPVDEKTAGRRDAYADDYAFEGQFKGYAAAMRYYGINVAGTYVRRLVLLKESNDHQTFPIYCEPWDTDRYMAQVRDEIAEALAVWERGTYKLAWGAACSAYGGCPFRGLCAKENPDAWIEAEGFARRPWNPVLGETPDPVPKAA